MMRSLVLPKDVSVMGIEMLLGQVTMNVIILIRLTVFFTETYKIGKDMFAHR